MKKSKREKLHAVINVLSWIVFIGLMIKAGAIMISYFISIANPHAAHDLYNGLDLYVLRLKSFGYYTFEVWNKIILCIAQAFAALLIIKILSKQNISESSIKL